MALLPWWLGSSGDAGGFCLEPRAQLVPALRLGREEQCSADAGLHSLNWMCLSRLPLPRAGLLPNPGTRGCAESGLVSMKW